MAKAIVNSPLVKTAVHGADPNWGRVAMAVGKATTTPTSRPARGRHPLRRPQEVYPRPVDDAGLAALSTYMRGDEVRIHVILARRRRATSTVWGCDLTTATSGSTPTTRRSARTGRPDHHFGCMRMPPSTRIVSAFM